MGIYHNLRLLQEDLIRNGWTIKARNDLFIEFENLFLHENNVHLHLAINPKATGFPDHLGTSLNNLLLIDPTFKKSQLVLILFSQAKNIKQKYSKDKNQWILSEPNSKYQINEIPDIYVPKL